MSLATFKRKTVNKYSSATKRSGKTPGGYWLTQGPFGNDTLKNVMFEDTIQNYGSVGFSLNGSRRSISVGNDMKMSKQGTRFRGQHPYGNGGNHGKYFQAYSVMNAGNASVGIKGNQLEFVKPTVTTTKNMLRQKYKGILTGKYPNNWVQPLNTGNLIDNSSQGLYIQNKASSNYCWYDVNDVALYENDYKCICENGIINKPRKYIQQSIAPYSKTIHQPKDSSDYILRIQRKCHAPKSWQKPFPFVVSNGKSQSACGTSITSFSNSCGSANNVYLSPPDWYTRKNKNVVN